MSYITWDAVTGRYKDAATIAGAEAVGSYWMAAAEAEVDGRLGVLYTVPFTPTVPELVRDLCVDLTYFKMIALTERAAPLKEYIDARFKDILAGTLLLTSGGTVLDAQASAVAWSTTQEFPSQFGADDAVNWRVSSGELQASQDARE